MKDTFNMITFVILAVCIIYLSLAVRDTKERLRKLEAKEAVVK